MARTCYDCGARVGMLSPSVHVDGQELPACNRCWTKVLEARNAAFAAIQEKQPDREQQQALREQAQALREQEQKQNLQAISRIVVSTVDLAAPYDAIMPIMFNTTNRGVFTSVYERLVNKYSSPPYAQMLQRPAGSSLASGRAAELGAALFSLFDVREGFEGSIGQAGFDVAFYIGLAELKTRAYELGADAVVGMRMDFDLDTNNRAAFYLQMYGTAVKLRPQQAEGQS